jgi:prepilin-type processing-associated H-X9-DG protein
VDGTVLDEPYWVYNYDYSGVTGDVISDLQIGLGGITKLAGTFWSTKSAMVRAPSDLIAFGDGAVRSPDQVWDGLLSDEILYPLTVGDNRIFPQPTFSNLEQPTFKRHRGRFNRVFCDTHVETEDFKKPFDSSDDYLRRFNIDNQPHRDDWLKAGSSGP